MAKNLTHNIFKKLGYQIVVLLDFGKNMDVWNSVLKVIHQSFFPRLAHCLKITQMSHINFSILAFSTNFSPIKTDLSGNTVWPQASGFQKLAKMDHFGIFD